MNTVIKNARIIDGKGGVMERGFIQFDEKGILEVSDQPMQGEVEIDALGKTVMPGLIDSHTHLAMMPVLNGFEVISKDNETMTAIKAFEQCQQFLKYGITTVRNMGTKFDSDITLRDMINSGMAKGPRILASGQIIAITGGHGHGIAIESDTVDEALKAARTQIKKSADVLKLMATGGVLTKGSVVGAAQLSEAQMRAVCQEAEMTGRITGAHCIGREGTKNAICAGVRSVEHGYLLDEELCEMMLKRNTFHAPTLIASRLLAEYDGPDPVGRGLREKVQPIAQNHIEALKLSIKAGVKIAASTDSGTPFNLHGRLVDELALYVKFGMSNMDALISATRNGAQLCMIDRLVGTLEKGKLADIIIIDGNPLEDIMAVAKVEKTFRSGQLVFEKH